MAKKPIKETWETATISNNLLFQHVMRNESICRRFLEKLLGFNIAKIVIHHTEKNISNKPKSKTSRLDVYVKDKDGTIYDIEMQTTDFKDNDIAKRSRYYQAQLDMDSLPKGKSYSYLRKSYVIFVCTFDPFKERRRVYTFHNRCEENNSLLLDDGSTRIFLNAKGTKGEADEEIIDLLRYIAGKPPEGKLTKDIESEIAVIKKGEEWRLDYMTWEMDIRRRAEYAKEQGIAIGQTKGEQNMAVKVIRGLVKEKRGIDAMQNLTGLSEKEIRNLAKKHKIVL